jgi:hypothetical protein
LLLACEVPLERATHVPEPQPGFKRAKTSEFSGAIDHPKINLVESKAT